jgi:transcriptional antiterminator RfaH
VEALRSWSDTAGLISVRPDFSPGQKVRVHAGPFAEKVGTLHRLDGHGRVQVLLELMGAQVPVDIAERALSAA